MLPVLLLAAAEPHTAVAAERAFAADAQTLGQWTAFRKWAANGAMLFWPQPVDAQAQLRPLRDPAQTVRWTPAASFASCDGEMAANTGPTRWPNGRVGYFSTIWLRRPDTLTWRWVVDHGDDLARARRWPARAIVRRASCRGVPRAIAQAPPGGKSGMGQSEDGTLAWRWRVAADGARTFQAWLWDGRRMVPVITDRVAAPRS